MTPWFGWAIPIDVRDWRQWLRCLRWQNGRLKPGAISSKGALSSGANVLLVRFVHDNLFLCCFMSETRALSSAMALQQLTVVNERLRCCYCLCLCSYEVAST